MYKLMNSMRFLGSLVIASIFLLGGCKQFNDDPAGSERTVSINLQELQSQILRNNSRANSIFAADPNLAVTVPADGMETEEVKSIVVGAMKVTKSTTPYTVEEPITKSIQDDMTTDIINSASFLKVIQLPTDTEYLEITAPPESVKNWQILAVALRAGTDGTSPSGVGDLTDEKYEETPIYFGFSDHFITNDEVEAGAPIEVKVARACLVDQPPKGCASYDDNLMSSPTVSDGVQIVNVSYNMEDQGGKDVAGNPIWTGGVNAADDATSFSPSNTYPIVVYSSDDIAVMVSSGFSREYFNSSSDAVTKLKSLRSAIINKVGGTDHTSDIKNIVVTTTHAVSQNDGSTCSIAWNNYLQGITSGTVAYNAIVGGCELQQYKMFYNQ